MDTRGWRTRTLRWRWKNRLTPVERTGLLSLRFKHEGYCDGLYVYRNTPRFSFCSDSQAAFLIAGWRFARPETLPLGLPGDLPQGFGAFAGVPSSTKSDETARWTRTGVSLRLS